ncbi:MAG: U32 family peptidase C-terminal domain-containing protein, partial [Clostridia bacterium]
ASEVQKVSHREYYTGFYFGDSDGQHSEDSSYIRDYGIAAMVMSCDDDGMAVISQKNRFFRGDTLELLEPGLPSVAFVVAEMHDMDGAPLDVAPHAMMQIRLKLPRVACEGAILRREKCDTDD